MAQETRTWDAIVIGGGIVGLSTALELQARGRTVLVLDRDRPRERASFGNAGVINRGSILPMATPQVLENLVDYALNRSTAVRVRYRALPAFTPWLVRFLASCTETKLRRTARALNPLVAGALEHHEKMAYRVGGAELIHRNNYLRAWQTPQAFARSALEQNILRDNGVPFEVLQAKDIRALEPSLTRSFSHALYILNTATVQTPGAMVELYNQTYRREGGAIQACEVEALKPTEAGISVQTSAGTFNGEMGVLAGGAWSPRLLAPLRFAVPFAAERGYHVMYNLRDGATLTRSVVDTQANFNVTPMNGQVRVMTGVELAQIDDPPDYAQLRAAVANAKTLLPLGEEVEGSTWMGSRPSTPDGLPIIGRAPGIARLLLAFGHGHSGFSTGPFTGRIVADLMTGTTPPIPIEPFHPTRFAAKGGRGDAV